MNDYTFPANRFDPSEPSFGCGGGGGGGSAMWAATSSGVLRADGGDVDVAASRRTGRDHAARQFVEDEGVAPAASAPSPSASRGRESGYAPGDSHAWRTTVPGSCHTSARPIAASSSAAGEKISSAARRRP